MNKTILAHEQLRSWYLARLRRLQYPELSDSLTPATLVKQDRAALETLITDASLSEPEVNSLESVSKRIRHHIDQHPTKSLLWIVGTFLLIVGFVYLATRISQPPTETILIVMFMLIVIGNLTMVWWLVQQEAKIRAITIHEQSIADYALEAYWCIDEDLRFLAVSPATTRLWGLNAADLLNQSISSRITSNTDEILEELPRIKNATEPVKLQAQLKRQDGNAADIEMIIEYSASTPGYFCIVEDITDRKNVERYKAQIMQMLSHDLRSPLTGLQFSLALIQKGKYGQLSESGSTVVEMCEKNIDRLINLINQLLELQKSEAGKLVLKRSAHSLVELIEQSMDSVTPTALQKNIRINMLPLPAVQVDIDIERMAQVFQNLLNNAIKFSPEGAQVIIEAEILPGHFLVEVRVKDSGPGIAQEFHERIFEQFFRISAPAGETTEGTGLGLAIARAIVQAHGGKIGVRNSAEGGACFFCHIPIVSATDVPKTSTFS